jgi:hypothetical protein
MLTAMECPQTPEHCQDHITQTEERLRVAVMRMSQAQELLTIAQQRLTLARLALADGSALRGIDLPSRTPMKPRHTP